MTLPAAERARLESLYRATTYRVHMPEGDLDLRIGRWQRRLDALLAAAGVSSWAFVAAGNPASRQLAEDDNARRHERLRAEMRRRGRRFVEGHGVPDAGASWSAERSLLVFGIDREESLELGRRYGQNAVVVGRVGEAAELLWCR